MGCHCIRLGWQRTSSVFTFECHGDTHGLSKSRSKRTVMPSNYPSILVLLHVVNKYAWLGRIRISFDISFSLSPYKSWTNHTATTTRLAKIISIRIAIGHQKCVYYYSSQVHYLFFYCLSSPSSSFHLYNYNRNRFDPPIAWHENKANSGWFQRGSVTYLQAVQIRIIAL